MEAFTESSRNNFIVLCKVQQIIDRIQEDVKGTEELVVEMHNNNTVSLKNVTGIRRKNRKLIIDHAADGQLVTQDLGSIFKIKKINNVNIFL